MANALAYYTSLRIPFPSVGSTTFGKMLTLVFKGSVLGNTLSLLMFAKSQNK